MGETIELTEAQCEQSQRRLKNGYGDKWPYKGYNYDHSGNYTLPDGWEFIYINTWGVHIRRSDNLNYMDDLN